MIVSAPLSAVSVLGAEPLAWADHANAIADDGSSASAQGAGNGLTRSLVFTPDLSGLPAGSVVLSVTVRVNVWHQGGSFTTWTAERVQFGDDAGAVWGSDRSGDFSGNLAGNTGTVRTFGGSGSDSWGLTSDQLASSDLRLYARFERTAGAAQLNVDAVSLEIEYGFADRLVRGRVCRLVRAR